MNIEKNPSVAESYNSSDAEAYTQEDPIPFTKQAYMEYQRNKRKALLRRGVSPGNQELNDLTVSGRKSA